MTTFLELGLKRRAYQSFFEEAGIKHPSEVQKAAIAPQIAGRSVVCIAQTGTGKTLAYALPIVERLKLWELENGGPTDKASSPFAIVLVPSRELVSQVSQHLKALSYHSKVRVRELKGGLDKKRSQDVKASTFDVLVATPLKIEKALKKKEIQLSRLQIMILDEGDQLFEGGFENELKPLLEMSPYPKIQIGFFSATLPAKIEGAVKKVMDPLEPAEIRVQGAHSLARKITTHNVLLTPPQKIRSLVDFLSHPPTGQGIVFLSSKEDTETLDEHIAHHLPRLKKSMLHGGLEGVDRQKAYRQFSAGKSQVLVASDLAARGLDLPSVSWVVNFDLPNSTAFYLHRCGRTGRMGKSGVVFNFITHHDKRKILSINKAVSQQTSLKLNSLPDLRDIAAKEQQVSGGSVTSAASRRGGGRFVGKDEARAQKKELYSRLRKKTSGRKKKRR